MDPSPEDQDEESRERPEVRLCARAYALGVIAHLTLPDAMQWSWLPANVILLVGALGVAFAPIRFALFAWSACAMGLAWPLLFLGDQLTQSAFLLTVALAGISCTVRHRGEAFPACLRALTIGAYLVAAFHKLNADFLDPDLSCATGGMLILAKNWSVPLLAWAPAMKIWPPLFLAAEIGLLVALHRRPMIGLVWALVMHIPLTIIFAPSFAFVMAPGWIAFLDRKLAARFVAIAKERWRLALLIGGTFGTISAGLYFRDHWVAYPLWQLKEFTLWIALGFVLVALPSLFRERAQFDRSGRALPVFWVCLWLLNGFTPYLGLQFHHAGAMLSNLRADRECWNHVLVPADVQLRDPYLSWRDAPDALRQLLLTRRTTRGQAESLCASGANISIAGDDQDGTFETDLCALPAPKGASLFQNELPVACHQQCMH